MEYAHRKALVNVERAEEDGWIDTMEGLMVINKGDIICTNEYGNRFVVDDDYFYDNYIMVKKLRPAKTKRKSPFELAELEENYKQSWVNQDDYIFNTKE